MDLARRLLAVPTIILALVAAASPSALARGPQVQEPCASAGVAATAANRPAVMAAVVCPVNRQRTARALPALRVDGRLDRSAQHWSSAMVADNDFSHGSNFGARIRGFGFVWSAAGENIATGYATPDAVVNAWMASPGHCRNILSPRFAFIGTGVSPRGIRSVGSSGATWTQDFGLPIGRSAPSGDFGPANGCPYKT